MNFTLAKTKKRKSKQKKIWSHKNQAQLERDYYNSNTELARGKRHLVEQNYLLNKGRVDYSSINAIASYDFDWAQSLQIPHFSQQPSQMYFLSPFKVHLFGIQNGATSEQTNYLIAENELLDKGVNGTLSLVFDGIKRLNRGEKHLKLTCDNCSGQNKNNTMLQFCLYLVIAGYYQTIELNFMIAGHTKFKVDGNFGLIKKKCRKSTVEGMDDLVEVVKQSSPAGLNKVQCYEDGQGFQHLNIKGSLEPYFKKLPNIQKYHHFLFSSNNLGNLKVQELAGENYKKFSLWKNEKKIVENIQEIKNLTFPVLKPKSLSLERQEYLYQNIQPLLPKKLRSIVFPIPN